MPFGEVGFVRDWLGLQGEVGRPRKEHAKRPVDGFECKRSEVKIVGVRLRGGWVGAFVWGAGGGVVLIVSARARGGVFMSMFFSHRLRVSSRFGGAIILYHMFEKTDAGRNGTLFLPLMCVAVNSSLC